MKKSIFILPFMFGLLLLMLVGSCTTKKGTTTKLGKAYHNITGRYNAYYNADLLLMKSFEQLNMIHQDNYNRVLPMYKYAAVDDGKAASATLDEAIKKCAINIEIHRPSNWVDDSYFIVGRAEYLKQDYEKAANTFKFIVDKYKEEKSLSEMTPDERKAYKKKNKKKKKKKKKKRKKRRSKKKKKKKPAPKPNNDKDPEEDDLKPKKYFLKHRPVRNRAILWLGKSYIEAGMYDEAGTYLRMLAEDETAKKQTRAEAYAAIAHSFAKQQEYEKAIEPLEAAVSMIRRKKSKTRYVYILAQLYQRQENSQLAMEHFRKVLRLRPNYEMEFNARLSMATNAADAKDVKINPEMALRRMLKDSKNEEYKDQIYYALAQIQLKSGNIETGIIALKMTMANSKSEFQRTEAAYQLAEIYYKREDYVNAYHYYDTTVVAMKKDDERFVNVTDQKQKLKDLALNIEIVEVKDSLLDVASWSYEKQRALAMRLRAEEVAAKQSLSGVQRNAGARGRGAVTDGPMINNNVLTNSKFPLYNASMAKKGEKDFEKKWGNRPWTDDWRRSNNSNFITQEEEGPKGEKGLAPMTEQEVKDYLKKIGVPQDSLAKNKMEGEIETAMFMVGELYYEELNHFDKSMASHKKLLNRYPKSKRELEALFTLYNISIEKRNNSQSDFYKEEIISKYPDSDIAKSLQDPNFLKAKEKELTEINQYYEDTYSLIRNGEVEDAFDRIQSLPQKYGKNYPLKPRFALLTAMCRGGLEGIEEYVKALKSVSTSYPDTEEDKKAKEMVALLTNGKSTNNKTNPNNTKIGTNPEAEDGVFESNMSTGHYVIIAFSDNKANLNDYKVKVSEYNTKLYSLLRLNVSSLMLDGKTPALIIRKFRDGEQAKEYYNTVSDNPEYLGAGASDHQVYFIGQNNYRTILQKRIFAQYTSFFDKTFKGN